MSLDEKDILDIAIRCHNTNKDYCETLGDYSQFVWEDAPKWQQDSAILGVKAIAANPDMSPEDSHKGWLAHKEAEGWVYGEVKDVDKKEHPCMLPYSELPEEQKIKDILFREVVLLWVNP